LKNLLVRNQCANDRRSVDIHISDKGIQLLDKIDKELDGFFAIMSQLNHDDVKSLNELLDKLRG
jgi:DNA-binding MarR family transcriptional regulator